ncbi:MAG: DUF4186 family protein [Chloroflexi bacterium]|nr:DUF4186 family protein [Chloroflexota bacterium]
MADAAAIDDLKSLGMTCSSTDCKIGLHYFRPRPDRRRQAALAPGSAKQDDGDPEGDQAATHSVPRGPCRSCGADLVDWPRVIRRDPSDIAHTFEELQKERIRHHFWHRPFDEQAIRHAFRKGRAGLRVAAGHVIRKSVGDDGGFDGRQTSMQGNVIFYAQHSTGSCCRKCIEEWHDIPRGRPLTEDEIDYLTELVLMYLEKRLPDLPEEPQKVPNLRVLPGPWKFQP